MQITYDPVADALHIRFREAPVEDSREDANGFILDYDRTGKVVGIEILDASDHIDAPWNLSYETTRAVSEHQIVDPKILERRVLA